MIASVKAAALGLIHQKSDGLPYISKDGHPKTSRSAARKDFPE